jgi:hypothetical protein
VGYSSLLCRVVVLLSRVNPAACFLCRLNHRDGDSVLRRLVPSSAAAGSEAVGRLNRPVPVLFTVCVRGLPGPLIAQWRAVVLSQQ